MRSLFSGEDYTRLMPWFKAVCSYDWADPAPLSELIRVEPVPLEFREAIATIINGERKPNFRATAKSKIPAAERVDIAVAVGAIIDLVHGLKFHTVEGMESIADRKGVEPIELIRDLEKTARKTKEDAAKQLGVSVETIKHLLRDVRARMDHWPVV